MRKTEGVDLFEYDNERNGVYVGNFTAGEWLSYTVFGKSQTAMIVHHHLLHDCSSRYLELPCRLSHQLDCKSHGLLRLRIYKNVLFLGCSTAHCFHVCCMTV